MPPNHLSFAKRCQLSWRRSPTRPSMRFPRGELCQWPLQPGSSTLFQHPCVRLKQGATSCADAGLRRLCVAVSRTVRGIRDPAPVLVLICILSLVFGTASQGETMEHLKNLTTQQLTLAASAGLLAAGSLLSAGSRIGYVPLVLAIVCGVVAVARSHRR